MMKKISFYPKGMGGAGGDEKTGLENGRQKPNTTD